MLALAGIFSVGNGLGTDRCWSGNGIRYGSLWLDVETAACRRKLSCSKNGERWDIDGTFFIVLLGSLIVHRISLRFSSVRGLKTSFGSRCRTYCTCDGARHSSRVHRPTCKVLSDLRLIMFDLKDTYTVAGVVVVAVVVVAGIFRYELQKDVAGAPSGLRIANAPVTTPQLTARGSSCAASARTAVAEISARSIF